MALHQGTGPVKTAQIARRQGIPPRSLEQIFNRLKRHGILSAERGPRGGYRLAAHPSLIPLSRIFQTLEGAKKTLVASADPTTAVWKQVEQAIHTTLEATTLETLIHQVREEGSFPHRFTFHI
jgi:Rrf2 family protein